MHKFWEFKALGDVGELFLYGEISDVSWFDDEVTPAQFQKDLAALGDISALNVYINSPGGDIFAGFSIYNILQRHKAEKTVHVDGLAASAASVVAMAGDVIKMPENATMMIHNAWTYTGGGAEDLRKTADELERLNGQIADIYAARTGKDKDEIAAMMSAETWMSGKEAKEAGFADELVENKKIAACANAGKYFAHYKNAPDMNEPDNGGEIQPTTDTTNAALAEQRERFKAMRIKILEV